MLPDENHYLKYSQRHQNVSVTEQSGMVDFIERLSVANTMDDLHQICKEIAHYYQYENFVYVSNFSIDNIPQKSIINGFPSGYMEQYYEKEYYQIDPATIHCVNNITSAVWKLLERPKAGRVKEFVDQAYDVGLRTGINVPLHGMPGNFGILSVGCAQEGTEINKSIFYSLPFIETLAGYLHEASHRILTSPEGPLSIPKLSDRQKEVLSWAALGKSSWEISQILSLSEHTVTMHIKNSMSKLGVSTRQHAIAKALMLKLIKLY